MPFFNSRKILKDLYKMENEIRILHIINDFGKGGAERALIDMCEYMNNFPQVKIKIVCLFSRNEYKDLLIHFDIEIVHFETFSLRKKNKNDAYENILTTFKPHIIHSHLFMSEILSAYYVDPNITYFTHGHDNMFQLKKPTFQSFISKQKLLRVIERRFLINKKYKKTTNFFIANSPDTLQFFRKNLPKNVQERIVLIPCGFNFDHFYQAPKSIQEGQVLQLVNVGSFQLKKNQQFLVDVAAELKALNIPFHLHFLGDGTERKQVEQKVQTLQLSDCVTFHGLVNDVENWYKKADIYLHAATYEPFGLVLLEAMAAGIPVVSLNGKGNAFILDHEKNGFIFDEQNPVQFATVIKQLATDKHLYAQITAAAQAKAKQFDKKIQSQRLLDFYYEKRKG